MKVALVWLEEQSVRKSWFDGQNIAGIAFIEFEIER